MRLLLVRHPEPEIPSGTCYGRLDLPLSATGEASLPALAAKLCATRIARLYTSPARRCRALADLIAPAPTIEPRLRELDFGTWEGRTWDSIGRPALDAWAAAPLTFAPPGGESVNQLIARLTTFCTDLHARAEDALLITHGGPLRLLPALLRDVAPDPLAASPPFATITTIIVRQSARHVV